MRKKLLSFLALGLLGAVSATAQGRTSVAAPSASYRLAPFGAVHVDRPAGPPQGVVIFLSDSPTAAPIARGLSQRGLLVATVSAATLLKTVQAWHQRCLNLNAPINDLSKDLQHRAGIEAYLKPVLIGQGAGAALAYAALSQWPNAPYRGVISIGFTPQVTSASPWCATGGASFVRVGQTGRWSLKPNRQIGVPWLVMGTAAQVSRTQSFVRAVPGANQRTLPSAAQAWPQAIADATMALLPRDQPRPPAGALPHLTMPLTLVQAATTPTQRDLMAIIYSGDGGWASIDRDVASQLAAAGIPVVGVDSLEYFWTARTPAGAGRDLAALIETFSERWGRARVLLIGYSFGADALPFMVDALPPAIRSKIERVSLLGLSSTADFQFHLSSWLDVGDSGGLPTIPAITRLRGLAVQCVRGQDEDESACGKIPQGLAQQYVVPGGHHFDSNAALLAQIILARKRP
ncbi:MULTISPECIES: virulence factor family protein [Sphingobium]|uniref:virulence factor family protein n=1 Tax=Sphingobium TaxID=165695 RepID=UPI0015EC74FA|nr:MULTISPECIES: virulence factor family protein [Sphingobium]MCW2361662.1 type IV secretory pathway VirJ component [Sphingobium sp. B10D3B]MCW2401659.1 type IV secretory pathway VirJ component [Sphingobium sp. B10D7B]MCW2408639.1 type IV secretory pathway VirJ component [Sphingobium xanthum]